MEERIILDTQEEVIALCGAQDRNLREVRRAFDIKVVARNGVLTLSGEAEAVARASGVLARLVAVAREEGKVTPADVQNAIDDALGLRAGAQQGPILGKVSAKSAGQAAYMRAMHEYDVVFCIGPAGTGKTYLAVARAVVALKKGEVRRIVLARPALEAGEKLGFLPGDLEAKVNPYLRPLYDALTEIMGLGQMKRYIENDLIEVVPLAYMRGRTLNDAFIILDEAQNCTMLQMKMSLTRMGMRSKCVITGDVSQIDLPAGEKSGLVHAEDILKSVEGLEFIHLTHRDIVRHKLVQDIVDAYERSESRRRTKQGGSKI